MKEADVTELIKVDGRKNPANNKAGKKRGEGVSSVPLVKYILLSSIPFVALFILNLARPINPLVVFGAIFAGLVPGTILGAILYLIFGRRKS